MSERRYLHSLSELIDRLCIVQLKAIFIPEHKKEYDEEIALIMHDIDLILQEKDHKLTARDIRAVCVLQHANSYIWANESKARAGGSEQDKLLKGTHSVNGLRSRAKNVISAGLIGERWDYKTDCLAAELDKEFGNWDIPL